MHALVGPRDAVDRGLEQALAVLHAQRQAAEQPDDASDLDVLVMAINAVEVVRADRAAARAPADIPIRQPAGVV